MTQFDVCASRYTGKERDGESGLDYFGARYYSSGMGRFMSPDWASNPTAVPYAAYANPQSLNLYNYMRNNPLSGTDPDGHCCFQEAYQLIGWLANGVATQGTGGFARNVGIGAAKGVGQAAYGIAAAVGAGYNPGAYANAILNQPAAITPSNTTQAQVAFTTSVVVSAAAPIGLEATAASLTTEIPEIATTTLFRAVDSVEADSITSTGQFLPSPNGTEYKGFFFQQSDAANFGAVQASRGGPSTTVVSGTAPTDLVNSSPPHSAATEGPGVLIKNENLPQVKPNQ